MKKPKFLYRVRVYKELLCDDEPSNVRYEIGIFDTYAESEDKAINNVRFRVAGLKSQYLPICTDSHSPIRENCQLFPFWKQPL